MYVIYVVLIEVIMLVNDCILGHFQVNNASMHEHARGLLELRMTRE